jgi:aspartate aminotransferase
MKIQPRAQRLRVESAFTVLARAQELEAAGRPVIHLEIGQPDFPTPAHICEAAARALKEGKTGYGPSLGLPALRRAIAADAGRRRGIAFQAEQVVVTPGAKPILFYAINALAGEGDEVIYPDPGFPMYHSIAAYSGARPVPLLLREEKGFRFDPEEFRSLLSSRTRLVVLNSPHNPTGGLLTAGDLEVVAEEAVKRDFMVLSDEIYINILYEGAFRSIAALPGMAERTVILDGFSKSYSMTGWRLGYGILPPALVETFDRYNINIVSCATTFNQYGALAAIEGSQEPVRAMVEEFRRRRDFLVDGLNRLPGVKCLRPGGAFYAFPSIRETGYTSAELAGRLLEEAGVAVLPGTAFGPGGEGYLRLSYANSLPNLKTGLERMAAFLAGSGRREAALKKGPEAR